MYTTMSLTVVGVDEGGNQPVQRRNCDSEGLGFNYGRWCRLFAYFVILMCVAVGFYNQYKW